MTSQPPPPPSGGGFPPSPPPGGVAQGPTPIARPTTDSSLYTPWFTRVLAYVIDSIPIYLLLAIGVVALITFQKVETLCAGDICATGNNGPSTTAYLILTACIAIVLVFSLWNRGIRQGKTGSSIGKQILKFKVVDDASRQPIGAGKSVVRELIYFVFAWLCSILLLVAVLFPLWDAKRQSLVDKLIKTVCVPL